MSDDDDEDRTVQAHAPTSIAASPGAEPLRAFLGVKSASPVVVPPPPRSSPRLLAGVARDARVEDDPGKSQPWDSTEASTIERPAPGSGAIKMKTAVVEDVVDLEETATTRGPAVGLYGPPKREPPKSTREPVSIREPLTVPGPMTGRGSSCDAPRAKPARKPAVATPEEVESLEDSVTTQGPIHLSGNVPATAPAARAPIPIADKPEELEDLEDDLGPDAPDESITLMTRAEEKPTKPMQWRTEPLLLKPPPRPAAAPAPPPAPPPPAPTPAPAPRDEDSITAHDLRQVRRAAEAWESDDEDRIVTGVGIQAHTASPADELEPSVTARISAKASIALRAGGIHPDSSRSRPSSLSLPSLAPPSSPSRQITQPAIDGGGVRESLAYRKTTRVDAIDVGQAIQEVRASLRVETAAPVLPSLDPDEVGLAFAPPSFDPSSTAVLRGELRLPEIGGSYSDVVPQEMLQPYPTGFEEASEGTQAGWIVLVVAMAMAAILIPLGLLAYLKAAPEEPVGPGARRLHPITQSVDSRAEPDQKTLRYKGKHR